MFMSKQFVVFVVFFYYYYYIFEYTYKHNKNIDNSTLPSTTNAYYAGCLKNFLLVITRIIIIEANSLLYTNVYCFVVL